MKSTSNSVNRFVTIIRCLLFCSCLVLIAVNSFADQRPVVKAAYMIGYEPYCWEENGVPRGMHPEILDHIARQLGLKAEHEFHPWARSQAMVADGKADVMITTPTVKRYQYAVVGKGIVSPHFWNIFLKKGNASLVQKIRTFKKLEDLKGYTLVDFAGNGWAAAFMSKGYDVYFVQNPGVMLQMIDKGRADLTINSTAVMNWWGSKLGVIENMEEYEVNWPWTRFHLSFYVSRKSPWFKKGLIKALDEGLEKMKQEGIFMDILKKYKHPVANGRPFKTMLDETYYKKNGLLDDYDTYGTYKRQ